MRKFLLMLAILVAPAVTKAVTFNVSVPDGTRKCYVCGTFNNWDTETAPELSAVSENFFSIDLPDVSESGLKYKYLCDRSWDYVEKDANGGEIDDRTTVGNPDVVESWRNIPEYNIVSEYLDINGFTRQIKIYLPEGYDESTDTYPVIYYNTVQQRYNNAGSESDPGDYFFGPLSWNAHSHMETHRGTGGKAYVMVQICSYLAENTPENNPEYLGTGAASNFLNDFISVLIPHIANNYRIKDGPENTTIIGADFAGLFSLYAAITHPEIFGKCVSMSPMLWINEGSIESIASSLDSQQIYYVSAGSLEPDWMINSTKSVSDALRQAGATVHYTVYSGATHNDDSWGENFPILIKALSANEAPEIDTPQDEFANSVYTLHSASNTDYLASNYKGTFEYTPEYWKKGSDAPVEALVFTQQIDEKYKSSYYWRIGKGNEGVDGWLNSTETIGFSSSRTQPAWQNVAIFKDGTIYNVAAVYNGFKVVAGNNGSFKNGIAMKSTDNYVSVATVSFPTEDKTFKIYYGSVNSGSDMGALTPAFSVSDNCTEAVIYYDFNLNKVTIEETKSGDSSSNPSENPQTPDFKDRSFTLYAGDKADNLQLAGTFVYTEDYRKKGTDTPVNAFVFSHDVPANYKSTYYWNIAEEGSPSNGWFLDANKTIGFSSSHSEISWLNVAIFEDGTTENVAAHSKGFKVVNGQNKTTMSQGNDHLSTAMVDFQTSDKSFTINFGSVNSSSDQGPLTPTLSVTENCIQAIITYDFTLNKVTINETKFGDITALPAVTSLNARPAVACVGTPVKINITLNGSHTPSVVCKYNFKETTPVSLQKIDETNYALTLENTQEGIYTISVGLNGESKSSNEINVRILPSSSKGERKLTVNAYENIDWDNIQRYKANFHTHTSQSFDTEFATSVVVDRYKDADYKILALTDHDANSYPWSMFSLYNPEAEDRNPEEMGLLAIPGNELSKDRRNSWDESTGGNFNHHNDFFTGRKGQEFMSLRESYAYTYALGGLQIINHPGQYWNRDTEYTPGAKNSPEWHAENFRLYPSLIGLEVYNQGNRRPNDRILWDQILTLNMPETPVWGYSCDDTHSLDQYFRNYQYMLMNDLTTDELKEAMKSGATLFSYEYTGSGQAKAPHVNSISVDTTNNLLTIDSEDADRIEWIYSTHRTGTAASTTQSTIAGLGNTFDYTDYLGSYVRARLVNQYGETATQPFGFTEVSGSVTNLPITSQENEINLVNDTKAKKVDIFSSAPIERVSVMNSAGVMVKMIEGMGETSVTFSTANLSSGIYIAIVATNHAAYPAKFIIP